LEKEPSRRFDSMAALADALGATPEGNLDIPIPLARPTGREIAKKRPGRNVETRQAGAVVKQREGESWLQVCAASPCDYPARRDERLELLAELGAMRGTGSVLARTPQTVTTTLAAGRSVAGTAASTAGKRTEQCEFCVPRGDPDCIKVLRPCTAPVRGSLRPAHARHARSVAHHAAAESLSPVVVARSGRHARVQAPALVLGGPRPDLAHPDARMIACAGAGSDERRLMQGKPHRRRPRLAHRPRRDARAIAAHAWARAGRGIQAGYSPD